MTFRFLECKNDSEQLVAAKEAGRQELLEELSYMNDVVSAIMWTSGPVARKIEKELSVIISGTGYRALGGMA